MKLTNLSLAVCLALGAAGAFAETGVKVGDPGYVADVNGRAGSTPMAIAGPLMATPADVMAYGREFMPGMISTTVNAGSMGVNEIFGRA